MNNNKEKLNDELLDQVSGGAGEDWSEIARRMMENENDLPDDSTQK